MVNDRPVKPDSRPHCYICGAIHDLTKDHIPPKGFFPPDRRDNLLTADCCNDCHRRLSTEDEVMRLWLSSPIHANEVGKWIADNKAMPAAKAKPKLMANIRKNLSPSDLYGFPAGTQKIAMDRQRVVVFMRRLAKASLYIFEPDYDYFEDTFKVDKCSLVEYHDILHRLKYRERGNGVFDLWMGAIPKTPLRMIAFRFYWAGFFVCMHSKDPAFYVAPPEGF